MGITLQPHPISLERSQCDVCQAVAFTEIGNLSTIEHMPWCPSLTVDVTAIDGTWGWHGLINDKNEWTHPDAPLWDYLRPRGLKVRADVKGRGFSWSTSLEGFQIWRRLFMRRAGLGAWEVGAVNLVDYHMPQTVDPRFHLKGCDTHIVAHSHGGNLPYIAAALGLKINVLVTVSTPVRMDVLHKYGTDGRKGIGFHIHYYSEGDRTQAMGELGDDYFGVMRKHPLADLNLALPQAAGHTGLLNNPFYFDKLLTAVSHIHRRHGRPDYLELRHAR